MRELAYNRTNNISNVNHGWYTIITNYNNSATNAALAFQKLHSRCYLTLIRQRLMLTGKILELISSTK